VNQHGSLHDTEHARGFPAATSRSISRRPMFPVGVVIVIMIVLQG